MVATQVPSFVGFPLGVTAGTFDSGTLDLTSAATYNPDFITAHGGTASGAEAAFLAGLFSGEAYFNIHSTVVPAGEIRGFLTPQAVPGPIAGAGLPALLGLAGAWFVRRRKQKLAA